MQPIQTYLDSFDFKFGDNAVWWQECLAEMHMGDPDFKSLKSFIKSSLEKRDEEWRKAILTLPFLGTVDTDNYANGYRAGRSDLQKQLSDLLEKSKQK